MPLVMAGAPSTIGTQPQHVLSIRAGERRLRMGSYAFCHPIRVTALRDVIFSNFPADQSMPAKWASATMAETIVQSLPLNLPPLSTPILVYPLSFPQILPLKSLISISANPIL